MDVNHKMTGNNCYRILRYTAAAMLLTVPFLAMPLAFARLTGRAVALFGLVRFADFSVMGYLALAVILLFPEHLMILCKCRKLRLLGAAAALFALNTIIQTLCRCDFSLPLLSGNLFWITVPLAAAALAPELRKIMPFFAAGTGLLLLVSGFTSEKFTGLAGNWNWTQGLIVALLPAWAVLWHSSQAGITRCSLKGGWELVITPRHRMIQSAILLTGFFLLTAVIYPAEFSRSAFFAAAGAAIWIFLRNRIPEKRFTKWLVITTAVAGTAVVAGIYFADLPDTRFQIWQGALKLFIDSPLMGAGYGSFSENIRHFLSDSYFFSPFPSVHIDHAHNDFLHLAAESGIPGILFYLASVFTIFSLREKTPAGRLCQWIFAVLLFCGWFDQHNFTLLCASFTAVSAGVLIARPDNGHTVPVHFTPVRLLFAAVALVLLFAAFFRGTVNYQNSSWIRQGDLKLLAGDFAGAKQLYSDSLRQEKSCHALYQLAELSLISNEVHKALNYISQMETYCGKVNYRHTQRIKAIAAYSAGELQTAAEAMLAELKNAPFSVISADFQRHLLRAIGADDTAVAAADRNFAELCRLREISPDAVKKSNFMEIDDGAFPIAAQKKHFPGNGIIPGIVTGFLAALLLITAVYGSGRLLLIKFPELPPVCHLASGIVFFALAALIIPPSVLPGIMFLFAVPGGYFAVAGLKKCWKTALIFTLIFLPFLAAMFLPPSSWDEQVYQLSLLKRYLTADSTAVLMDNPYSAYPSLGQLWVLSGVAAGGMNVPQITLWFITVITAASFYSAGKFCSRFIAAVLLGTVVLSPLTWLLIRAFYVESIVMLAGFSGVCAIFKNSTVPRRMIFFAGCMAGMAAAVKLPGTGVSIALMVLVLTDREKRRYTGYFIAGALIMAIPFFLRVFLACGNPVYPYLSSVLGDESAMIVEKFYHGLGSNYGINPFSGIIFNWLLTAFPGSDYDGISVGVQFPVLVLIILAALVYTRGKHPLILIPS